MRVVHIPYNLYVAAHGVPGFLAFEAFVGSSRWKSSSWVEIRIVHFLLYSGCGFCFATVGWARCPRMRGVFVPRVSVHAPSAGQLAGLSSHVRYRFWRSYSSVMFTSEISALPPQCPCGAAQAMCKCGPCDESRIGSDRSSGLVKKLKNHTCV